MPGEFKEEVFRTPMTPQEWKEVADGFWRNWQLPHTIWTLDGKQISVCMPPDSESKYSRTPRIQTPEIHIPQISDQKITLQIKSNNVF